MQMERLLLMYVAMHAMGWVLKIPHRLRNVCEIVIMLKVLSYLKLFYRSFFDNKYKVS